MSLRAWQSELADAPMILQLRVVATSSLASADRLASSVHTLNVLGARITRDSEPTGFERLKGGRVPGKNSVAADWLSRLAAPNADRERTPLCFKGIAPKKVKPRDHSEI